MKIFVISLLCVVISSCTSINVMQVDDSHKIKHVCIENNPKVIVSDFVQVIEDVFNDHSITTEIYNDKKPKKCNYKLTYTALRSWDIVPYLSHAEIGLFKNGEKIGYAEYHLNGKGGLALNKWASVRSRIVPVIEKLLSQNRPPSLNITRE